MTSSLKQSAGCFLFVVATVHPLSHLHTCSRTLSRERRRVAAPRRSQPSCSWHPRRRRPRYRLVTAESFKTAVRSGWDLQGRPAPTRLFLSPVALAERAPSFSGPVTLVLREARLGRTQPGCVVGGSQGGSKNWDAKELFQSSTKVRTLLSLLSVKSCGRARSELGRSQVGRSAPTDRPSSRPRYRLQRSQVLLFI